MVCNWVCPFLSPQEPVHIRFKELLHVKEQLEKHVDDLRKELAARQTHEAPRVTTAIVWFDSGGGVADSRFPCSPIAAAWDCVVAVVVTVVVKQPYGSPFLASFTFWRSTVGWSMSANLHSPFQLILIRKKISCIKQELRYKLSKERLKNNLSLGSSSFL